MNFFYKLSLWKILNGHSEDVQDILRNIDTINQKDIQRVRFEMRSFYK